MRATLMYLSAGGLLLVGLVILMREPGSPRPSAASSWTAESKAGHTIQSSSAESDLTANHSTTNPSSKPSRSQSIRSMTSPTPNAPRADGLSGGRQAGKPSPDNQAPENQSATNDADSHSNDSIVEVPLPAVRLSDDVQLPAVILTLNQDQADPENLTPQPIKDAMKSIVDTFYQDLAKAALEGDHVSQDPDGTYVIGKGNAVDRARDRANEIYRALFGEDAYNRMTMNAVLESQIPVEP